METKRLFVVVALLSLFSSAFWAAAEGLSAFKLHNGATVYIWGSPMYMVWSLSMSEQSTTPPSTQVWRTISNT